MPRRRFYHTISLIIFTFIFIGISSSSLAYAQVEPAETCKPPDPNFFSGHQIARFNEPEDYCSLYRVSMDDPQWLDYFKKAEVSCIPNPKAIYEFIGDPRLKELITGRELDVGDEITIDEIANIGLDSLVVDANRNYFSDPRIEKLTNYFSHLNWGLANSICTYEGVADYDECLVHIGACFNFASECRENYFISTSSPQRYRDDKHQYLDVKSRCEHIIASHGGGLDEGAPKDEVTFLDKEGLINLTELCKELPPTYNGGWKELSSKEQRLYRSMPPMISLERGFLVINRFRPESGMTECGISLTCHINKIAQLIAPDLQVIEFFIPGLVGSAQEAKRELRTWVPAKIWDKQNQMIETVPIRPFNPNPPNPPIDEPKLLERPTYKNWEPVIDLINSTGLRCESVEGDDLLEFSGGTMGTNAQGGADTSWKSQLPASLDEFNKLPNQDPEQVYQAWLIVPKYLAQLDYISDQMGRMFLPNKINVAWDPIKDKVKTILPLSRDPKPSDSTSESRVVDPLADCEPNPLYEECQADGCSPLINCKESTFTLEYRTTNNLSKNGVTGGVMANFWQRIKETWFRPSAATLISAEKVVDRNDFPCRYDKVLSSFPDYPGIVGGLAASFDTSECAPTIGLNGISESCVDQDPQEVSPNACESIDKRLGMNIGYGTPVHGGMGDSAGKPVTFLLNVNASLDEIQNFINTEYAGSPIKIVRITGITFNTSFDQLTSLATNLESSNVKLTSSDYIILGNELNNLAAEYVGCGSAEDLPKCGSAYRSQFNYFNKEYGGSARVAPSPLDTLNSDYDAKRFLDGALSAYQGADVLAANSYLSSQGCKYEAIRCTENSYIWLRDQVGQNQDMILTEFGLAPPIDDLNLTQVEAFIRENVPKVKGYVQAITPLIRNVCGSGWLRFNCVEFVNDQGRAVFSTSSTNPRLLAGRKKTLISGDSSSCNPTQHLFETTCNDQLCHDYIIDRAISSEGQCKSKYLNPYIAIAIALNENGGLVSGVPTAESSTHFGCDIEALEGYKYTIEDKTRCMIKDLVDSCNSGLSGQAILDDYKHTGSTYKLVPLDFLGNPSRTVFVSQDQAQQYSDELKSSLPDNKEMWYKFYEGYIKSYSCQKI